MEITKEEFYKIPQLERIELRQSLNSVKVYSDDARFLTIIGVIFGAIGILTLDGFTTVWFLMGSFIFFILAVTTLAAASKKRREILKEYFETKLKADKKK